MGDRYDGLTKIIAQPAARLLAVANAGLSEPLKAPAAADVATVLRELDRSFRPVDALRVLSVALPVREGVWWACLAGRDVLKPGARAPRTLTTAEAWAFDPTEEKRRAAREALDAADTSDPTTLCAMAVAMCDGTLGPGDLAQYEGPPGGAQTAIFGMNMLALAEDSGNFFHRVQILIARALDIGRGGNGAVDPATVAARMPPRGPETANAKEPAEDEVTGVKAS
jgi:hypothetical protein